MKHPPTARFAIVLAVALCLLALPGTPRWKEEGHLLASDAAGGDNFGNSVAISGDTVVVGQGEYFELWTPDQWKSQQDSLDDLDANIGRFDALDLSPSE